MRTPDFDSQVIAEQLTEKLRAANRELSGFLSTAQHLDESPDPEVLGRMATRLLDFGTLMERAGVVLETSAPPQVPGNDYALELLHYGSNLEALCAALNACASRLRTRREELQGQLAHTEAAAAFHKTLGGTV